MVAVDPGIDDPTRRGADVPPVKVDSGSRPPMNGLRPCSVTCDAMIPWSMARCEDCERDMDRSGTDPGPLNLTTTDDFDRQCKLYRITCLYHLTHIDNLPSIRNLGLLSHNRAHDQAGPKDIADPEVIARRSGRRDTVFDRPLHDYVPLYFTPTNPMLSARRGIQSELAILCISKGVLLFDGAVFTDGQRRQRGYAVLRRLPTPRPARLGVYQSPVLDQLSGREAKALCGGTRTRQA